MNESQAHWISLTQARERMRTHPLRLAEVPVEHSVSLPMPTRKWGGPAYAFFAAAAVRRPDRPVEQGVPDRWWVVDALGGRIVVYALTSAVPFAESKNWTAITLPPIEQSVAELRQGQAEVEEVLNGLVPLFFAGDTAPKGERAGALARLFALLPAPLHPQYRALAPDFFAWLEA